jgi:hypothetical protein
MTRVAHKSRSGAAVGLAVAAVTLLGASVVTERRVEQAVPVVAAGDGDASTNLDVRSDDAGAVVAAFSRRSYRPGVTAVLELWNRYPEIRLEVLQLGADPSRTATAETMYATRVLGPIDVPAGSRSVRVRIGDWESGMYAALLTAPGKLGFAPFVLGPRRLGESRVAVVQPTHTWQAYNFRDGDGDGLPDSWYYRSSHTAVDVSRPYVDGGVPPHFRQYDLAFLRWLFRTGRKVDMLAQEDIERLSGDRLARLYRLIVFPGHHEYVTRAEYDAVERYRDLGGNLAFLSANNFFWRVDRHGDRITRVKRWRDLGRPEAALVGVQYFQWNLGKYKSQPYIARGVNRAPWLFAGLPIQNGDRFGWWGIEVDRRTAASPRSTLVLARMPNALGTRWAAEMTYYETGTGARVFAAGAFTLGGAASIWTASRLLENLWQRLASDDLRGR